jgi:hypothetical protein
MIKLMYITNNPRIAALADEAGAADALDRFAGAMSIVQVEL